MACGDFDGGAAHQRVLDAKPSGFVPSAFVITESAEEPEIRTSRGTGGRLLAHLRQGGLVRLPLLLGPSHVVADARPLGMREGHDLEQLPTLFGRPVEVGLGIPRPRGFRMLHIGRSIKCEKYFVFK
jgi:hypothetical protein